VSDVDTQPAGHRLGHVAALMHGPLAGRRRIALLVAALAIATALLLWLGQPAGAALLPLAGLLLRALLQRDRRARALARQIASRRFDEKIEVRDGAWGELGRSVNGLMQAQRVQERLRAVLPAPLPAEALQALLGGQLSTAGEPRMTTVLLVSCAGCAAHERDQRGALVAWRALAQDAYDLAQHHSALLQPCGSAILLAFGAFVDQPIGESLRAALAAAEALQHSWRDSVEGAVAPLVLSLSIGPALAAALPGLGYCVLGVPVEEAVQLQQLAHQMGQHGLISGERVYYARRQADGEGWQPTDLRIPVPNRVAQVVYARIEHG
jgi:class 3 adenylate cyclase